MNWIRETENDLRGLKKRQLAIINIKKQINILLKEFTTLKCAGPEAPVKGGMSRQEDAMLNNIVKRDRLSATLEIVTELVALVENALKTLSSEDQMILTMFYIDRKPTYIEDLCEKFSIERSQVYRKKDEAIKRLTMTLYGLSEM